MTYFTLTVASSADAFIARSFEDAPQNWASAEEQELFFRDVEAADWAIMGRNTHEAADRPDRRRIVFSSRISGWRRPTQLWLSPEALSPRELAREVSHVYPLRNGLILGGTRVHDWFLKSGSIDAVNLTIEPVRFGEGLPIFSGQHSRNAVEVFEAHGFRVVGERTLNDAGTTYLNLVRPE